MRFSPHLHRTDAPALTDLMARARELARDGPLINLAQAVVDFPPPAAFLEAVRRAMEGSAVHRYTPDPGLPRLREMLAGHIGARFGLEVDPYGELHVTPGANSACFFALSAMLEPGDEVIIPSPWYFNHAMAVQMLGGVIRPVITRPSQGHVPDLADLAAAVTPRTRAVVLVNPNNPTGCRYPDDWLAELATLLSGRGIWVVSDQTYQEMVYDGSLPVSIGSLPGMTEWTATTGSFSKSLALAGWRIGFLAGPADLLEQAIKIHDSSVICAPHATQLGLLAALPDMAAYLETTLPVLRGRRDVLMESLAGWPDLTAMCPAGSPFVLVHLPGGIDAHRFSMRLLEAYRVAAMPADNLGPGGKSSLRLSFSATGAEDLQEAGQRLGRLVSQWGGGGA